ncbi:hypothetical protein HDU88_008916 [Geranomyces variabilis]|nr:hypothetical protein HDU88_008916 [Geranomyces variabilis]
MAHAPEAHAASGCLYQPIPLPTDLVPLLLKHLATPSFHFIALVRLSKASRALRVWVLTHAPLEYRVMHQLSCSYRLLPCLPSLDLHLPSPSPVPAPAFPASDDPVACSAFLNSSIDDLECQDRYLRLLESLAHQNRETASCPVLNNEVVQCMTVLNNMVALHCVEEDFKNGFPQDVTRSQILLANGNQHMLRSRSVISKLLKIV